MQSIGGADTDAFHCSLFAGAYHPRPPKLPKKSLKKS